MKDNPHTCKHILVAQTILHQYVVWWPACKVMQCTTKMSRTQDWTIWNWCVNIIAASSPILLISEVCLSCGFNSRSKFTVQPSEWYICHLVFTPEIRRAKICINYWNITSNLFLCGYSFFTLFLLILTLSKTGSSNRSSHYNRGWFNGKGCVGSEHGWGWFIGATYTFIKRRTISQCATVCHYDCTEGFFIKNSLTFEQSDQNILR